MHQLVIATLLLIAADCFARPMHIIIDPGHGGRDNGAVRSQIREADITLQVSKKLRALLAKDKRFKVSMTRVRNKKVELRRRAEIANELRGDLFISIHANASVNRKINGAEIYLQNHLEPSEEMMFLAAREQEADDSEELKTQIKDLGNFGDRPSDVLTILDDLVRGNRIQKSDALATSIFSKWRNVGRRKRNAVRQAPFFLVSNVHMPSVLVELGYISHKHDSKKLTSNNYQAKMAKNIYKGLVDYHQHHFAAQ